MSEYVSCCNPCYTIPSPPLPPTRSLLNVVGLKLLFKRLLLLHQTQVNCIVRLKSDAKFSFSSELNSVNWLLLANNSDELFQSSVAIFMNSSQQTLMFDLALGWDEQIMKCNIGSLLRWSSLQNQCSLTVAPVPVKTLVVEEVTIIFSGSVWDTRPILRTWWPGWAWTGSPGTSTLSPRVVMTPGLWY